MAQSIVKFLVRRGTDLERQNIILADGELGATKDNNSHRLFVGDGVKPGGWAVGSRFYMINSFNDVDALRFVQQNDLVFIVNSSTLYALTGTNNVSSSQYLILSTP